VKATKRSDKEILADIAEVESGLSPENLSCDGELDMSAQRPRMKALVAKWHKLVKELGRFPKIHELMPDLIGAETKYGQTVCTEQGMAA
jgi:hypothetical protein